MIRAEESCRFCGQKETRTLHLVRNGLTLSAQGYECWDVARCNKRRQLDMAFERLEEVAEALNRGERPPGVMVDGPRRRKPR